jgi:hypothetical protein
MNKQTMAVIATSAASALFFGCLTDSNPVAPGGDKGSFLIVNSSAYTIQEVYISATASGDWGNNKLSQATIGAGSSHRIEGAPVGIYDTKIRTSTGLSAIKTGVTIVAGEVTTITCTTADFSNTGTGASVTLSNQTSHTIWYFYVSRSTDTTWGSDELDSNEVISSGEFFTVSNLAAGTYDLKVSTAKDSLYAEKTVVALSADGSYTWTVTDAMLIADVLAITPTSRLLGTWNLTQVSQNGMIIPAGTSTMTVTAKLNRDSTFQVITTLYVPLPAVSDTAIGTWTATSTKLITVATGETAADSVDYIIEGSMMSFASVDDSTQVATIMTFSKD